MTSAINPNNINGNYPVANQPNNTQGFRDNFTNTKTNFQSAADEITDLQNKAVLKVALTGGTLDNNMNNQLIYAALIQDFSATAVAITATSGSIAVDYSAGHYQTIVPTGSISLSFANFPVSGQAGLIRLRLTIASVAYTVTLPSAVSVGTTGIQGLSANTITFGAAGTYEFDFETVDGGTTITIFDLNRPLSYYTNNVTIAANTVSTSSVTGALTVAGGVGVVGDLVVGGNIVGNLTVASQTFTGNLAAGNINSAGQLSAAGNINGGNIITNLITASALSLSGNILTPLAVTSNITGGNILTAGNVTGSYFIGNGSQLTGITVAAGTALVNGNSNVRVNSNGNTTVSIGGTSNVAVFATTGEYVTGVVSASGNITGGNLITSAAVSAGSIAVGGTIYAVGTVSAVGNITTSGYILGNGSQLTGINSNLANLGSSAISTTGNITGGYLFGNGSTLTGLTTTTRLVSGTTELAIEVTAGNIQASVGGTANVVVFTPTGINVRGNITSLGTGNCFVGNGSLLSNVVAVGVGSAGLVSTAGNVTGGNIRTGGTISATGNITCGFIDATGNISLTGNIIAGNLTTGFTANVVGNITGGNYLSDGQARVMSATAPPAGGVAAYLMSSTANLGVFFGSGAPTISAAQGSLYMRTDGSSTSTRMYVNTNGTTGWTAVTTAT